MKRGNTRYGTPTAIAHEKLFEIVTTERKHFRMMGLGPQDVEARFVDCKLGVPFSVLDARDVDRTWVSPPMFQRAAT